MLSVVIVEDEYYVRKGLVQTFDWASLDCEVIGEAANGREGEQIIIELKPDLVIADIEMPVVNGIEMVKALKSKQCKSEYIFLTAHQKFSYVHSALKLEAMDYLLKPFSYDDLAECIRKVKIRLNKVDSETAKTLLLTEETMNAKSLYIKDAINYVREHYSEDITIPGMAQHLNISEAYFCRLFKKETGYTFGRYLTHYRIHVAAQMLTRLPIKVSDAAEQTGFTDPNYFSSTFKRIMHMSPSKYQELNRE